MTVTATGRRVACLLALAVAARAVRTDEPMNPFAYEIANPAPGGSSSVDYRGEYFEFLGPLVTSKYSEVAWYAQTSPLPTEIVKRFAGKVMAVTGYEVDIVRNGTDGFESVPCWEQCPPPSPRPLSRHPPPRACVSAHRTSLRPRRTQTTTTIRAGCTAPPSRAWRRIPEAITRSSIPTPRTAPRRPSSCGWWLIPWLTSNRATSPACG